MNELLKIILSLSLSGSILILILLLLRPLYKDRMSWRWQYYIWLLVIARLLLPLTPDTSVTGSLFRQVEIQFSQIADSAPPPTDKITGRISENSSSDSTGQKGTDAAHIVPPDDTAGTTAASAIQANHIPEDTLPALCIFWLVIALLMLVRKITIYQSFVKYVDAGSIPVDDFALLERFGQILAEQHIRITIDLRVNSLVSSPLLIGFRHARIILPTAALPTEDFYYAVLHELTHYRRRDMFYKWLVQLAVCLHWFNPLVYLMDREINRLCELSCDERVISTFPDNSRKVYGDTLLNAIGTGGTYKDTVASVTLYESKELLRERLNAIMNYRKISKWIQISAVFLTGILIGGAVVLGAYAAQNGSTESSREFSSSAGADSDHKNSTASIITMKNDALTENDTVVSNSLPDYTIQYEDDIFYIMVDGADEDDKPLSIVTQGYKKLVLVRKDEYTTIGAFANRDMPSLARYVKGQCRTLVENGRITQESADIFIKAAEEIQTAYTAPESNPLADWIENHDNSGKNNTDYQEEYNEQNIVIIKNAYYYQNARVRILMDVKADGSFENFAYNERGTVDLRLIRDTGNKIIRVEYLTREESAEILEDIGDDPATDSDDMHDDTMNIIDLNRLTRDEVSDALRQTLDSCDTGKWYLIDDNGTQYIYYNGLSHTYAYEPWITGSDTGDLITVRITDINVRSPLLRSSEFLQNYVLLSFSYTPDRAGSPFSLTIKYNDMPVTYELKTL